VEDYRPGGYHPVVLGDIFNRQYKIIRKLGEGSYSTLNRRLSSMKALDGGVGGDEVLMAVMGLRCPRVAAQVVIIQSFSATSSTASTRSSGSLARAPTRRFVLKKMSNDIYCDTVEDRKKYEFTSGHGRAKPSSLARP
jgi:hypothetical protein